MSSRPIENCYWVRRGGLLAGEYPRTLDAGTSWAKVDALVHCWGGAHRHPRGLLAGPTRAGRAGGSRLLGRFGGLLLGALLGIDKERLLAARFSPVAGLWEREPLCPEIDQIAGGSFRERMPPEIAGTGYVVQSLEAALWAFHHSSSFAEGALLAANLGHDADTTAAIYGQLAGAYYGAEGIPGAWCACLAQSDLIRSLAASLQPPAIS